MNGAQANGSCFLPTPRVLSLNCRTALCKPSADRPASNPPSPFKIHAYTPLAISAESISPTCHNVPTTHGYPHNWIADARLIDSSMRPWSLIADVSHTDKYANFPDSIFNDRRSTTVRG